MKVVWALVGALLLALTGGALSTMSTSAYADDQPVAVGYADPVAPHGFFWQVLAPQQVIPGVYLYALPASHAAATTKGTRSDQQFFEISSTGDNDVPEAALRAYKRAAAAMAKTDPSCDISWTLLAAIGRVESNHGRFGGSELGSDGVSRPAIVGPRLDGAGPFAAISDTDGGRLDGDKLWDRAVGQMQFLPGTWASVARDGDGDGVKNPGDLDDSALASAVYLCGAGNLSTDAGKARAAFRYNQSDYYVALVLAFTHGFQTGVFALPSPPPPPGQDNKAAAVQQVADAKVKATKDPKAAAASATPKPTTVAKPKPSTPAKPSATPKPAAGTPSSPGTPSASPTPAKPVEDDWNGPLKATANGLTLGGLILDLDGKGATTADADWDGDGATESVADELTGLDGRNVKVHGSKGGDTITFIRFVGILPS